MRVRSRLRIVGVAVVLTLAAGACGGAEEMPETPRAGQETQPAGPSLWIVNQGTETVSRLDPATNQITATIEVGAFPTSVTVGGGAVWVANAEEGTITKIDPASNSVAATFDLGDAREVLFAEDAVWVSQAGDINSLAKLDPETGDIESATEVDMQYGPGALTLVDGTICASPGLTEEEEIACVDLTTVEVTATIPAGDSMWDFALTDDGSLWAAGIFTSKLYEIDAARNEVVDQTRPENRPLGVAFGEGSLWVPTAGELYRIDPATGEPSTASIEIGFSPEDVLVADGSVWVADSGESALYRVDPATDQVTDVIPVTAAVTGAQPGPTPGPTPTPAAAATQPVALAFG